MEYGGARIGQSIKAFWGDTDGIILYVTVMLVVIVGVAVLALDGSRYRAYRAPSGQGDALGAGGQLTTPTAINDATKPLDFVRGEGSTCSPSKDTAWSAIGVVWEWARPDVQVAGSDSCARYRFAAASI